ncbi:unnamed protein product [Lymnaea stagnalis]|uniref:Uncharacterized protein n=1 Tax=Lymnaea stagnalis TaxID=6523 RepID=A0AAV2HV70_LYMST
MLENAELKISEMPLQESDCAVTYKVLIIGDHAVGKTSLLSSLTNRGFQERVLPTVGVDFVTRIFEVDGALIQLQIWDCSGLERFRSITNRQFKGVQGLVLVYDVTNEMSFKSLKHWLKSINIEHENRKNSYEPTPVVLCGNKCDRICDKKVSRVKGEKFADRQMMFGYSFVFPSLLTGR